MSDSRIPIAFRLTRQNRNSVAALLAVVERELGAQTVAPRLLSSPAAFSGEPLLVYSFASAARSAVVAELATLRARWGAAVHAVAGGCHVSAAPRDGLAMGFRWVLGGEAGPKFAALVAAVARGEPPSAGVLGQEDPVELDRYPPWPGTGQLFAAIELTRGCPMGCTFCQTPRLFGRRVRHRNLAALEATLRHSCATGHRYTRFVAPNAFGYGSSDGLRPEPAAVEALLVAARRAGMERLYLGTFPSEVRPESVRDDLLALVRDHCENDTIAIGLQSGSDRVLRAIRRGHTARQGIEAVERVARAGFTPKVDFIFGLPGESDADRAESCAVIRHLVRDCGASVHAHPFTPLPGTPLAAARPERIDPATTLFLEKLAGDGRRTGSAAR